MADLKGVLEAEIRAIAAGHRVAAYAVGFDVPRSRIVIWKLRFDDGEVAVLWLSPAAAIHFTKGTRRAARHHKWPRSAECPDAPELVAADWDGTGRFVTTAYRGFAERSGTALFLEVQADIARAIFLPAAIARGMAQIHWDALRSGELVDLAAASPEST